MHENTYSTQGRPESMGPVTRCFLGGESRFQNATNTSYWCLFRCIISDVRIHHYHFPIFYQYHAHKGNGSHGKTRAKTEKNETICSVGELVLFPSSLVPLGSLGSTIRKKTPINNTNMIRTCVSFCTGGRVANIGTCACSSH